MWRNVGFIEKLRPNWIGGYKWAEVVSEENEAIWQLDENERLKIE